MAKIDIELSLGPRAIGALAALLTLGVLVSEVSSENINLTTFYPSPAGVYATLISAGQTFVAINVTNGQSSRGLTIGSTQGVQGTGRLVIPSGSVGIGTVNPNAQLHIEGNETFGDVTSNVVHGLTWSPGSTNGTGFWYGINREPGPWSFPYPSLKIDFHTGLKIKAHGGYGGVAIYEDYCETGQSSCGTGGAGIGTEIARFRIDPYGGSYINSRLGLGGLTTPGANIDVGGDGVAVFEESGTRCYAPISPTNNAGCGAGTFQTTQSGVISATRGGSGFSTLCCQCPYGNCAGMP